MLEQGVDVVEGTESNGKDFSEYFNRPRHELLEAFFRKPGVVLEWGCGAGATGRLIKERWPSARVFGADLDPVSLDTAARVLDGVIFSEKDPSDTPLFRWIAEKSVDTLILADVLEHLENPWKTLRWLRQYLRDDAQIIVSLPNVQNLGVLGRLRAGQWHYAQSGILDVTHLRFFTKESALSLLASCGYEVIQRRTVEDVRLLQAGRPVFTSSVQIGACALSGVSPAQLSDLVALQHIFTARVSANWKPVAEIAEIPAAPEDKSSLSWRWQLTPTAEEVWRQGQMLSTQEVAWLKESVAHLEDFPKFIVVMRQNVRNSVRARRALESLADQVVRPHALVILRESGKSAASVLWPELPQGLSGIPVTILDGDDWDLLNQYLREGGDRGRGRWLVLLDSGDFLESDALARVGISICSHPAWRVVYTDEDQVDDQGHRGQPHLKPDFLLDTLRSVPYIGGMLAIDQEFLRSIGGMPVGCPGAEEYDLVLRAAEVVPNPERIIGHVARVLYHRCPQSGSDRIAVETIVRSGKYALASHLERSGERGRVDFGPAPATYRVEYALPEELPLVSVIIPTKNQMAYLNACLDTLFEKTDYPNFEVIIIDNGSCEVDAVQYLDAIRSKPELFANRIRVFSWVGPFDYAAMHNAAIRETVRGDVLLFLNNDTAILHADWMRNLVRHALRPQVGAVGAKLLFADGKVQHAGVILGLSGGGADHPFLGSHGQDRGYFGRLILTQNYEAVTAACMAVRKADFDAVGGFSEEFPVQFNDVDLCLKLGEQGLRIVWTPDVVLLHHGSASQRAEVQGNPEKTVQSRRIMAEANDALFRKWSRRIARDRAYNPNFTRHGRGFQFESIPALCWQPEWRPRKRVFAHPVNREGTGEYRIIAPARALSRAGRLQTQETMQLLTPPEMLQSQPDSVIFQLQMEDHQSVVIRQWTEYCPDTLRVFEIDDLVIHLPMKNAHRPHIHPDIVKRLRHTAERMHRMVVTTEYLAEQYRGWNADIRVVPNFVERARWGALRTAINEGKRPRVGWVGGVSHLGDLELIQDVVKATRKEIDWVFMGMCPESLQPYVTFVKPVPFDQYPAKVASLGLDLALAPLEDHPFNLGKSHLRVLEMGILGIPVLATDILPYRGFPIWMVKNRYRDWLNTIKELLADRDALRRAGTILREHIEQHWILEDHLDLWESAWT
ncbi:glycosyltransferase [Acidithiobacillus caldus]|uniref:O-antigen biosynthesis protein n=1 Tax=Acidithiobacillus caldus (strain ATCC 51756 / DSM 8584 / KU) TaxID=637389 RepID=A0A060A0X5_ACICK|nr:glycosyltransferase [Acidithiobacillus caldus]AIA55772.1 O-antigen biosynthesis protein [Acidithiobacillus caldus ATCC 51756]MBU2729969.1 glycosyltransferase [Acidithiobacillus caldus]MBU2734203.1 glycosyltransferase [Acidithiobacillus caldus ATCC 51756]MBU2746050.1 glycosyltransferase [Acidithiobacillus caldus]MBU2779938.1 glycosyltransferase [Acidithiobacillus caldus]